MLNHWMDSISTGSNFTVAGSAAPSYKVLISLSLGPYTVLNLTTGRMSISFTPNSSFNPRLAASEEKPFALDSRPPSIPFKEFAATEARFAMLASADPERSEELLKAGQEDIDERRRYYEQLAGLERGLPGEEVTV